MTAYRTPGVYFEQADTRSQVVGPVRTDIAGFVGIAARGPIHRPIKVQSWTQFVSVFGDRVPQAYLAYAVDGFFSNGGDTCWIVRVADPDAARPASAVLYDQANRPAIRLTAATRIDHPGSTRAVNSSRLDAVAGHDPDNDVEDDPGVHGNQLKVTVLATVGGRFSLTITRPGSRPEVFRDLSLDPDDDRDVLKVLNSDPLPPRVGRNALNQRRKTTTAPVGSRLVKAEDLRTTPFGVTSNTLDQRLVSLSGGNDGLAPSVVLSDDTGHDALRFLASPAGGFGRVLQVECRPSKTKTAGLFNLTVRELSDPPQSEEWTDLTLDPTRPKYVVRVVNDRSKTPGAGSRLVSVRDLTPPRQHDSRTGADSPLSLDARNPAWFPVGVFPLSGGLNPTHLTGPGQPNGPPLGLSALESIDEVSVVAMPDLSPPQPAPVSTVRHTPAPAPCEGPAPTPLTPPSIPETPPESAPLFSDDQVGFLYDALILHAEQLKDRVVLIDPPAPVAGLAIPTPPPVPTQKETVVPREPNLRVLTWLGTRAFDSKYAALYYPWLRVDDPLGLDGSVRSIPPSGHVAGVFARSDRDYGVHKPPANMEVNGARDVTDRVGDPAHGDLNERGVNVIRPYPGRGIRVYGARTLSSDPDWRFLNVRRLMTMIEVSIDRETQWVVFEPNNITLRDDLDRVIRNFLNGLWQRGMLDGTTPNEAYEVRCDETTNPPEEVDVGRLICLVGVQPPAPAEFVIVRIGKTREGTVVLEDA